MKRQQNGKKRKGNGKERGWERKEKEGEKKRKEIEREIEGKGTGKEREKKEKGCQSVPSSFVSLRGFRSSKRAIAGIDAARECVI